MPDVIGESQVVKIWQDGLPGRIDLETDDGEPIEIVYPGRPNDDRGADLRDAVIATRRGLMRGDIEIHVRSSGWWAHRHHEDPAYNRVILHVVFWHDTAAPVNLEDGRRVPTLALQRCLAGQPEPAGLPRRRPVACRNGITGQSERAGMVLDRAGDERFEARSAQFREALECQEAGQALYGGVMEALGYSKNKPPMAELARRLPLKRLEAAASGAATDTGRLAGYQAWLLGTAGLLPSQRGGLHRNGSEGDAWVKTLEGIWAGAPEKDPMTEGDWHVFKVRPGNLPARRLAAIGHLLLRYGKEGLLPGLVGGLEKIRAEGGHRELEERLLVPAEGYWARNLDFGLPGGAGLPALLGRGRAAVIAVNVLLPFAAAWGRSRPGPAQKARLIYRDYPALAENTLERHMGRQLGLGRRPVGSARRQQGLIHIYRTFCSQGRCNDCPLGGE
ncbi:MAG: DUF2851 family protein [Chloroflexota bacterium]